MLRQFHRFDWILLQGNTGSDVKEQELRECAQRVWPIACSLGRREINTGIPTHEKDRLIDEAWEYALSSIAKMKRRGHLESLDHFELDAYLMKAFQHRLGRLMKSERMHHHLFTSIDPLNLAMMAVHNDAEADLHRRLRVQEIVERMDSWTKEVWGCLSDGKSWDWIASRFDMNTAQAKMRYRYYLGKIGRSLRQEESTSCGVKKVTGVKKVRRKEAA